MTWNYAPTQTWKWNGDADCVEFTIRRIDPQMRDPELTIEVQVFRSYLERAFGIPRGSKPLDVARDNEGVIEKHIDQRISGSIPSDLSGIRLTRL